MKILFIFNDKKLTETLPIIDSLMSYIDKKHPGAFIKFDIMENENLNDMTELIEAYHENDFDVYIITVKSDIIYDEKIYTDFFTANNIQHTDVMGCIGSDSLKSNLKEIKKFVTSAL